MGQCTENNGKLLVLMYWNALLSPSQNNWWPFEQELWGVLQLRRQEVTHVGRIPMILHTDHGNAARLGHLALEGIEAKHYRWHAELTQGGTLLLYRPGSGDTSCPMLSVAIHHSETSSTSPG